MGAQLSSPVNAMVVERLSSECWESALATMQGWRKNHEDAHFVSCGRNEAGVFAILDGHGGQGAARMASHMLEERLLLLAREGISDPASATEKIGEAFIEVDKHLRGNLPVNDNSGTTVVAAMVTRPTPHEYCVHLAHCGDSRVLLSVGGQLISSVDHKPEREDETARIVAAGGSVDRVPCGPSRVDGVLAVSRSMGDFRFKLPGTAPALCKVSALPEVQTVKNCTEGDWLLLACDGIFDVMENWEVRDFVSARLRQAAPAAADGGQILTDLLSACLDKGSKDNCTACLVRLLGGGTPQPRSAELLQGGWASAAPEVRSKYAEFFALHGFQAEAAVVREEARALAAAGQAKGEADVSTPPKQNLLNAVVRGLRIRSSHTIQAAWRRRMQGRASDGGMRSDGAGNAGGSSEALIRK